MKDKEKEEMKVEHGIHEHRMKQAAEMWDRERLQFEADATKAKNQAAICEHLHISKAQHGSVVGGLEARLAVALQEIATLKDEKARLEKQLQHNGPGMYTSLCLMVVS